MVIKLSLSISYYLTVTLYSWYTSVIWIFNCQLTRNKAQPPGNEDPKFAMLPQFVRGCHKIYTIFVAKMSAHAAPRLHMLDGITRPPLTQTIFRQCAASICRNVCQLLLTPFWHQVAVDVISLPYITKPKSYIHTKIIV